MLMGQYSENRYVQTFSLSYSSDDVHYTDYANERGEVKVNLCHLMLDRYSDVCL